MNPDNPDRYKLAGGLGTVLLLASVAVLGWWTWRGRSAQVAVDQIPQVVEEQAPPPSQPALDSQRSVAEVPVAPSMDGLSPIRLGGEVTRPEKISGPNPQYTEIARKARIQGVVIVEAIIDKTGMVRNVRVLKPLPMGLDQAAVEAIRQWRFKPATLRGVPVDVYYNLTVNFRLQ